MPVSNTTDSYGSVARAIHWLMALLVISMIPLGIRANTLARCWDILLSSRPHPMGAHKSKTQTAAS